MKRYGVTITYQETRYVEVEADDEDDAVEKAAAAEYITDEEDCEFEVEDLE
jgi:hypothetical protein